jgi:uncharacterized protein YuzE
MKIEFDPEVDALYVQLSDGDIEVTEEIKPGVMLDYDSEDNILGLEVLNVSKREKLAIKEAA